MQRPEQELASEPPERQELQASLRQEPERPVLPGQVLQALQPVRQELPEPEPEQQALPPELRPEREPVQRASLRQVPERPVPGQPEPERRALQPEQPVLQV